MKRSPKIDQDFLLILTEFNTLFFFSLILYAISCFNYKNNKYLIINEIIDLLTLLILFLTLIKNIYYTS
jgi:hypothetical protein